MSPILGIGIELEGRWGEPPEELQEDRSVEFDKDDGGGEVASGILKNSKEIENFLKNFYPDEVDSSCGLHIHISTGYLDYCRLMRPGFYKNVLDAFRPLSLPGSPCSADDRRRLRRRLAGDNAYCRPNPSPSYSALALIQSRQVEKNLSVRYHHLNFCHGVHGTVEFRMLPMFEKAETALSAVKLYLEKVESYLSDCRLYRGRPRNSKLIFYGTPEKLGDSEAQALAQSEAEDWAVAADFSNSLGEI